MRRSFRNWRMISEIILGSSNRWKLQWKIYRANWKIRTRRRERSGVNINSTFWNLNKTRRDMRNCLNWEIMSWWGLLIRSRNRRNRRSHISNNYSCLRHSLKNISNPLKKSDCLLINPLDHLKELIVATTKTDYLLLLQI